jgi:hypothetical protein
LLQAEQAKKPKLPDGNSSVFPQATAALQVGAKIQRIVGPAIFDSRWD